MKKLFTLALITGMLTMTNSNAEEKLAKATFAGGCFWCMEKPFEQINGVKGVVYGYTGGHVENPTYKQVSSGTSGHVEVIQVTYDPSVVNYQTLLENYWINIDPEVSNRQFCDVGEQYRSEIFVHNAEQRKLAEASKKHIESSGIKVTTQIVDAVAFYPAEDYHQGYYKKNPLRYKYYRYSCGRDERLDNLWGENRQYPKKG